MAPNGVSVIATVRNEGPGIEPFLDALRHQSVPIEELVISDGGSTDGTYEALLRRAEEWPELRVVHAPAPASPRGATAPSTWRPAR